MKKIVKQVLKGLLLSLAVGVGAHRKKSLSGSGILGAMVVGTTCYSLGGPVFYSTLLSFFGTGSLLSHYGRKEKENLPVEFEKGGSRDFFQVLANGGIAAICAILHHNSGGDPRYLHGFLGSVAAATADTWATEIGVLSNQDPVHIVTGETVPRGTSGGISPRGNLAALAGSLLPGMVAACISEDTPENATPLWIPLGSSLMGGLAGVFLDSLLGATIQAQYICPKCKLQTEKKMHRCGEETHLISGISWINNDMVNLAGSLVGALAGVTFYSAAEAYSRKAEDLEYYLTL